MTKIFPGDIVDFTVKGVRVVGVTALTGEVSTIATEGGAEFPVPMQAVVTRVAPAAWPPRPGDLWREVEGGGLWFVFRDPSVINPSPSGMRAREANGDRWTDDPLSLIDNGPLTLVHREDEQDGSAS